MSGVRRLHCLLAAACLSVAGCALLRPVAPGDRAERADRAARDATVVKPSKDTFRLSQYVFYSDLEVKRDAPLFKELAALREQVYRELKLPQADALVHVYLFADKERYDRYIRAEYPQLPERRAFFVAQPRLGAGEDLMVFTFWSDRVRQDLRHELTHALLHSVLKDVPLWLDEGLAEYFELPPSWDGLNRAHVRKLVAGDGFKPNLAQLEGLSQVKQMDPVKYREAWAWVYLMLHGPPEAKEVLLAYLQQLRTNGSPGPLQPRLAAALPAPEVALDRLLANLEPRETTTQRTRFAETIE